MLLFLTALDEEQEERRFSCLLHELEVVFEFLNHVIAERHTLINVFIIEKDQHRDLPVEAFDGVSVLSVFRQLELEWTAVLAEPPRLNPTPDPKQIRWCREQLALYEQHIIHLESMITDTNRLYQRAEDALRSGRQTSANPYQAVLTRYEAQLSQAHLLRKELFERL